MATVLKAYANCDDVFLVWKPDGPIADCLGFALFRKRAQGSEEIVPTWVGFEGEIADSVGEHKPSTEWPIQRYTWVDFLARKGDRVSYRVVPMIGEPNDLQQSQQGASEWTKMINVATGIQDGFSSFFNRGIVAAQWVSRRLGSSATAAAKGKKLTEIINTVGDQTRNLLGGELRAALIALLEKAKEDKVKVFASLYELSDPELIDLLKGLGARCQLILANGSVKTKGGDQNEAARAELKQHSSVKVFDRMLKPGILGHNKFLVFCDAQGAPESVWTGSTNWTQTGLCTQANNGLFLRNAEVAAAYMDYWKNLKKAGSESTEALRQAGAIRKTFTMSKRKITVWTTPIEEGPELQHPDLEHAIELINGARHGLLFLMFNPGPRGTLLNAIIERTARASEHFNPGLYIQGVVNQDPGTKEKPVKLFHRGSVENADLEVILPREIDEELPFWVPEIRKKPGAFAMVHSKVVVIDPIGKHPAVITGSHNLGPKASAKNDDNMIIVENDSRLAQEYAVNIMTIYNQYRWRWRRSQFKASADFRGLERDDSWQDSYFKGEKAREIDFWLGEAVRARAATGPG